MASSVDPDQTAHEQSSQELNCLPEHSVLIATVDMVTDHILAESIELATKNIYICTEQSSLVFYIKRSLIYVCSGTCVWKS